MFSDNENRAVELFLEYTKMVSDDVFIDYTEECESEINAENAGTFVDGFLNDYSQTKESLKSREYLTLRDKLIIEIISRSNLSVRQIAGLLDINRGIVQRILAKLKQP